jgi:hypothetical protein
MSIRLNGWQRIGVILSLLWVIVVGGSSVLEYFQLVHHNAYFVEMTRPESAPSSEDREKPERREPLPEGFRRYSDALQATEPHVRLDRVVAAIVFPLGAAWILAYLLVIGARWVAAGFRKSDG